MFGFAPFALGIIGIGLLAALTSLTDHAIEESSGPAGRAGTPAGTGASVPRGAGGIIGPSAP